MKHRVLTIDLSSNNGPVNLGAYWNDGYRVLIVKATEGTTYHWASALALAEQWHKFGGIVGFYTWPHPDVDVAAQARVFYQMIRRHLRPLDFVAVDIEAQFTGRPWAKGEAARTATALQHELEHLLPKRIRRFVYSNAYFARDNGVHPITPQWLLWLAAYPSVPFVPPGWREWTLHQFTQSGHVAGVTGNVDVSRIRQSFLRPAVRSGDRNYIVREAKRLLHSAGYRGMRLNSDKYGIGMRRAVAKYKRDHHCPNRDGAVFGAWMWRNLAR